MFEIATQKLKVWVLKDNEKVEIKNPTIRAVLPRTEYQPRNIRFTYTNTKELDTKELM